ncbi:MAG: PAS domain S-box protein [Syntrophobacteraceae bacterium]
MQDENKTKEQLIGELHKLRVRLSELEQERADLNETRALLREREESYRQLADNIDKRAEESEKRLRTQLANALEMAHLGPWEYDVVNDIFTFNDHFYKIFRTSAEKIGGYTMSAAEYASRFVHPEDMHVVSNEVRKAIETSDPHFSRKFDHRILYEDGATGFMSVLFFIVKDSHGKTIKTYGVNQDVSERKRAEEALRESEKRFYSLFSNMVEGVALHEVVFDESGAPVNYRVIDHNVQYEKILGLRREDVIGKLSTEIYHTSEPPFLREYSHVALSGAPACLQEYFAPLDRHFEISITPWGNKGFATIFSDVTERKKAETALRAGEQKYRELVENANSAIIRYNSDGAITFFNEYAQNFFGYREEKIVGRHIGILVPDQDSTGADLTSLVQDIISHPERHVQNVNENVRSDGTRVWVAWTNKPAVTQDGDVTEILTVGTDITELKRAEQEREQLQQQLLQSRKMESVGRLAGGVAHDYNNMLGVIIGYTEMALADIRSDDPSKWTPPRSIRFSPIFA